jgi:type II secretory pathway component PulF
MDVKLTFDALPAVAVLLVLAAYFVPKFKTWYEALAAEKKQLFMALSIFVVVLGAALLSALGFLSIYVCTTWQQWVWYPLVDFVIGLMTTAGVYKATNYMFGNSK